MPTIEDSGFAFAKQIRSLHFMNAEVVSINPIFLVWIAPIASVVGAIVVIAVFMSKSYAKEYSCPSIMTASQFEPMAKIGAMLFGHAGIAMAVVLTFHCDYLFLKGIPTPFGFLPYVALGSLFVCLWCTLDDQFYVNVAFCTVFLVASVAYMAMIYRVVRREVIYDVKGNVKRIMFPVINGALVVLWFAFTVVTGRDKSGTMVILKAVWSYLLVIGLNAFLFAIYGAISSIKVKLVVED